MKKLLLIIINLKSSRRRGSFLPVILLAATLFIAYATALLSIAISNLKMADLHNKKITSEAIAEAGINYYMWHLSHFNQDFCDGGTCGESAPFGPYTHDYTDQSGASLGTYSLFITPPSAGSAVTTVKSIGRVNGKSPEKTVVAQLGMPSFTKYTLLVNGQQLWLGSSEKVDGSVHVNNAGLYNEGTITGDASSTELQYNGWFGDQPGVAGPGVFGGAKLFPVPQVDFNQVSVDIAVIKDTVENHGGGQYFSPSSKKGYYIVLGPNSYMVYKVKKYDATNLNVTDNEAVGSYAYPSSGVIFVEDDLWVEGQINGRQITIVAADPAANNNNQMKRIIVTNPLKYTAYNGSDKIGLITQTDILVAETAPTDMEIDAAMIAKNGEIRINYYPGIIKDRIKVYGSMAHNTGLVWTYGTTDGTVLSGYRNTELVVDQHNISAPPPDFPTMGVYSILSWREE